MILGCWCTQSDICTLSCAELEDELLGYFRLVSVKSGGASDVAAYNVTALDEFDTEIAVFNVVLRRFIVIVAVKLCVLSCSCVFKIVRVTKETFFLSQAARDKISKLKEHQDVGWLRLDVRPVKQVLLTYASKWMWTFINYLSKQASARVWNVQLQTW